MAILRSFFRNNSCRTFLSLCASSSSLTTSSPYLSSILSSSFSQTSLSPARFAPSLSHLLSPFSRCLPFSGPLFLSSPPFHLLQSATPLYLRGETVFQKVQSEIVNRVHHKEIRNDKENSGGFYDSFVNAPNVISMSRLVSGPFIGWMIINEWYLSAFFSLAVSGATDWLDGYVARKMGINSVVGSYLDPLADKVLIGCVALAMVKTDLLQPWLVGLVVFRDVGLVGGALYQRANSLDWKWKSWSEFTNLDGTNRRKVEPLFISKVNTVFQLLLVAAALVQPEFGTNETQQYITFLSWLVASTTVASTVAYGSQYMQLGSRLAKK